MKLNRHRSISSWSYRPKAPQCPKVAMKCYNIWIFPMKKSEKSILDRPKVLAPYDSPMNRLHAPHDSPMNHTIIYNSIEAKFDHFFGSFSLQRFFKSFLCLEIFDRPLNSNNWEKTTVLENTWHKVKPVVNCEHCSAIFVARIFIWPFYEIFSQHSFKNKKKKSF